MTTPNHDREVLRGLASRYAEIAALPVQQEKRALWRRLNRLEPVRPLVWINEIPWHEMNVDDELTLQCEDAYCREVETQLRQTLYQWRHMPGDMVVDPFLIVQYRCSPTSSYADYGVQAQKTTTENQGKAGQGSVGLLPIIQDEADVAKIRTPEVTVDWAGTERDFQRLSEICDGILPVEKQGITRQRCSPWDQLIFWYGIEQLYLDMVDRPELVHSLIRRFMAALHEVLDRQEAMGLLSAGNGNHRVGSGGLGITDELPSPGFDPAHVRPLDQWGTSAAQIFSEVSPDMHEEFSLQYERPYLERFGLTCYGCCEPLHRKIHLLRTIKNLRRISMSYWVNITEAAEQMGADYIFSYKPTPAVFAGNTWEPETARANLRDLLEQARGCRIEIIMKDITTVRQDPARLWAWEKLAMEMAEGAGC